MHNLKMRREASSTCKVEEDSHYLMAQKREKSLSLNNGNGSHPHHLCKEVYL